MQRWLKDETRNVLSFGIWCALYWRFDSSFCLVGSIIAISKIAVYILAPILSLTFICNASHRPVVKCFFIIKIFIFYIVIQSTPVISRLLGAKIRERELSGSPVISRCRAKATTREFRITDPPIPRRLQLANSMLSDNRGTYVSRISTHIDIAPATNDNKQH